MSVEIKSSGRKALVRCTITTEILRQLKALPNKLEWKGRDVVFEPTSQALDYILATWPDAHWDEGAMKYRSILETLRSAAPAQAKQKKWDYVYKTKPFEHQEKVFKVSRDAKVFALLMEQGTGKSKVICDNAAWLFAHGQILGLLIIAKNGAHRNWIDNEIPKHLPDWCKPVLATWDAQKGEKKIDYIFKVAGTAGSLPILAINVEALSTKRGEKVAERFLLAYPSMAVVDESTTIKNPKANRTKAVVKLGAFCRYRRILTGTPVTRGPLDLYSQYEFLDENILGHSSFFSYRARYAVMRTMMETGPDGKQRPKKSPNGYEIKFPVGWQNLEELQTKTGPHSFRVLKKDCLDLPEKLYTRRYFDMTDEQWHHYHNFEEELFTEFQDRRITAALAITKMLRLQQITSGYLPAENPDLDWGVAINEKNPRIELLMEQLEEIDGSKIIIFSHYRAPLRDIWKQIIDNYGEKSIVTYSGAVKSQDARALAVQRFQNDPKALFFLAQTTSAAYSLTLTAAEYMTYFNNNNDLEIRLQSEDRAHRIGQTKNVLYTDVIANGTTDVDVLEGLLKKRVLADLINGDPTSGFLVEQMKDVDKNFVEKFRARK